MNPAPDPTGTLPDNPGGLEVMVIDGSNTIRKSAELFPAAAGYPTRALIKKNPHFAATPVIERNDELLSIFTEEAHAVLTTLAAAQPALAAQPADRDTLIALRRGFHTLKGSGRIIGLDALGAAAHAVERLIDRWLDARKPAGAEFQAVIAAGHRLFADWVSAIERHAAAPDHGALLAQCDALLDSSDPMATAAVAPLAERRQARPADEIDPQLVTFFLEEADAQLHQLAADLRAWRAAPAQTEIGQRLARLLHTFKGGARMCGAMGIGALTHGMETRIEQAMAATTDEVLDDLDTSLDRANQMVSELRQQADVPAVLLRARMVPFATVVERLHRVVRLTAKELGRQANLDIRGGDTPVDRSVLKRMLGPLEHLLRNAVAHGIEPATARRAAGKPELGQITLTIAPSDNDIALTLADDGRGLDYAAIRARAIEHNLLAGDEADDATRLAALIFRPGFSTAATVNAIAGRGVGLDVVRDQVAQLGGHVEVSTYSGQDGQGTRFDIVLPLTLAVIPAAMAAVAPAPTFAAPSVMVVDDSLTVRKITGLLLERAGYRVLTAKDGVDALEQLGQLGQKIPAAMLVDIEMPRMDGFELVRALRADPRLAALPVIMITSRSTAKHRQVATTLGVQHYLGKPYDETELLSLIATLISDI